MQHRRVEQRAEIDAARLEQPGNLLRLPHALGRLGRNGDDVRVEREPIPRDDLPQLRYTNAIFSEGLRLYPPAWAIARRALEDVELGGYLVPKSSIVLMCTFVTQRDARWYIDPEQFRPERWLGENPERPKFAYFPFGGGARVCIGERFAGMEGPLLLASIAQKWRFTHVPGHKVEPRAQLTLRPRFGMQMTAVAR